MTEYEEKIILPPTVLLQLHSDPKLKGKTIDHLDQWKDAYRKVFHECQIDKKALLEWRGKYETE